MAQRVKNLPAMQETWIRSLGQEDPLEEGMATHSSVLAWKIPWTEGARIAEDSVIVYPRGQRIESQSWTPLKRQSTYTYFSVCLSVCLSLSHTHTHEQFLLLLQGGK